MVVDTYDHYFPDAKDFLCPGESRRSCADISIISNPNDNAIYKPNPIVIDESKLPKTFTCMYSDDFTKKLGLLMPDLSNFPDNNKYNGTGVFCMSNLGVKTGSDCNKVDFLINICI